LDLEKAKRGEYTMAELIWREDNGCLGEYKGAPVYLKKGKFGLYAEYGEKQTISLRSIPDSKSTSYAEYEDFPERFQRNLLGKMKPLSKFIHNKVANEIVLEDVIRLIEQKTKAGVMDQEEAAAMFLPQSVFDTDEETTEKSNVGSSSQMVSSGDHKTSDKTLLRQLRTDLSIRKGKYGPYIFHKTAKMSAPKFHPIKPLKDKWETMSNLELIAAIENTYRLNI
jgi:hypothetical protein